MKGRVRLSEATLSDQKATFYGIDWGGKDFNAMWCPGCRTPHRWRKHAPKRCRGCGMKFVYTAAELPRPAGRLALEQESEQ